MRRRIPLFFGVGVISFVFWSVFSGEWPEGWPESLVWLSAFLAPVITGAIAGYMDPKRFWCYFLAWLLGHTARIISPLMMGVSDVGYVGIEMTVAVLVSLIAFGGSVMGALAPHGSKTHDNHGGG